MARLLLRSIVTDLSLVIFIYDRSANFIFHKNRKFLETFLGKMWFVRGEHSIFTLGEGIVISAGRVTFLLLNTEVNFDEIL